MKAQDGSQAGKALLQLRSSSGGECQSHSVPALAMMAGRKRNDEKLNDGGTGITYMVSVFSTVVIKTNFL